MNAIEKICAKKLADCTPLEKAVRMYLREDAAEQLAALEAENIMLKAENIIMYSAILEASTLGNNAALRCQVELQRIAKKDNLDIPKLPEL
jgi:hypothetical protein